MSNVLIKNSYFVKLSYESLKLIKKKIFPTKNYQFKKKLKKKINHLLIIIAKLSSLNKDRLIFNLITRFVFNICIRIYVIDLLKKQKFKDFLHNNSILKNYDDALKFLKLTKIKNKKNKKSFKIKMDTKNCKKYYRAYSSIIEIIWQKQFKLLLDPFIDKKLYKYQFAYRKNNSVLFFMAKLHDYLTKAKSENLKVIKATIFKCFIHKQILKNFP